MAIWARLLGPGAEGFLLMRVFLSPIKQSHVVFPAVLSVTMLAAIGVFCGEPESQIKTPIAGCRFGDFVLRFSPSEPGQACLLVLFLSLAYFLQNTEVHQWDDVKGRFCGCRWSSGVLSALELQEPDLGTGACVAMGPVTAVLGCCIWRARNENTFAIGSGALGLAVMYYMLFLM